MDLDFQDWVDLGESLRPVEYKPQSIVMRRGEVGGADLDELARLDADVRLFATELDQQAPPMFDQVSGYVGWDFVGDSTVEVLKPGIKDAIPGTTEAFKRWQEFRSQYSAFLADWDAWYSRNSGVFSSMGAQAEADLNAYQRKFNAWRKTWISRGGKTSTVDHEPTTFWSTVPWGKVILVSAVILLPFYLPVLTGLVYTIVKGKAATHAVASAALG